MLLRRPKLLPTLKEVQRLEEEEKEEEEEEEEVLQASQMEQVVMLFVICYMYS
jgi:CO dehydrogenase/acetyl-CoA synthase beta subunit